MLTVILVAGILFVLIAVTGGNHHLELWNIKITIPEIKTSIRWFCGVLGSVLILFSIAGYFSFSLPSFLGRTEPEVDFHVENHLNGEDYGGMIYFTDSERELIVNSRVIRKEIPSDSMSISATTGTYHYVVFVSDSTAGTKLCVVGLGSIKIVGGETFKLRFSDDKSKLVLLK